MTEKEIFQWLGQHIVSVLLVLSFFIQIIPIKINPWSSLIKWIGKLITASINTRLDEVEKSLINVQASIDQNQKDRIRWEVLDFANSCREGKHHTKDQFQHIIALNDKYKGLLIKTNDKNGIFDAEYQYIQAIYKERQQKNDFI